MPEREDFALRAVHEWSATLPSLDASAEELSVFIRMSRIAGLQDRIDDQTLREFETDCIRGSDDFRTLALLRRSPEGLTNSELIEMLGGSKAGMSARLDRLTNHGVTERTPSELDRRSHTNTLTPHGITLADRVVAAVVHARKTLTRSLSSAQIETLADTLAAIIDDVDPGG